MNQGMPGGLGQVPPTPPPPMGGSFGGPMGGQVQEEQKPHDQILAALAKIEEKLDAIAAKLGA